MTFVSVTIFSIGGPRYTVTSVWAKRGVSSPKRGFAATRVRVPILCVVFFSRSTGVRDILKEQSSSYPRRGLHCRSHALSPTRVLAIFRTCHRAYNSVIGFDPMLHAAAAMRGRDVQRGHDRSGSGDLPAPRSLWTGKCNKKRSVKSTRIVRPLMRSSDGGC